jgi:ferredoxin
VATDIGTPAKFVAFVKPKEKGNLLSIPFLGRLVRHRAFQYAVILPNLLVFWLVIVAGFFGSPVGNMNLSITFVWMLWWFALIALMVPLGARVWCTICPIPAFGEWIARHGLVRKDTKDNPTFRGRAWPRKLRNIWPQSFGFLLIATFSALIVTRPVATGIVLLGLILIATVMMLIYSRRAFCRYVCPVGGFLGLFSMTSTVELRAKDKALCQKHISKDCIKGCDVSFGCPWFEYPGTMERNNFCGLCFECVKACPFDNIAVRTRPFGQDLLVKKGRGLDEAWKTFIMLTLAVLYIVVMQGPWGTIRNWANVFYAPPYGFALTGLDTFALYVGIFWGATLVAVPAIFFGFAALSRFLAGRTVGLKEAFTSMSYAAIPLALTAWIAFSIPIVMVNWSYIAATVSDPFGWGWNLFGTRDIAWQPLLPQLIPYIQVAVVDVGLALSARFGVRIARDTFGRDKALRAFAPILAFLVLTAMLLIWLFTG